MIRHTSKRKSKNSANQNLPETFQNGPAASSYVDIHQNPVHSAEAFRPVRWPNGAYCPECKKPDNIQRIVICCRTLTKSNIKLLQMSNVYVIWTDFDIKLILFRAPFVFAGGIRISMSWQYEFSWIYRVFLSLLVPKRNRIMREAGFEPANS